MAPQKTKRRTRKARAARRAASPAVAPAVTQSAETTPKGPRVAPKVAPQAKAAPTRRQQREERERRTVTQSRQAGRALGTYGVAPKSIFAPLPVSEVAIFAGIIGVIFGWIDRGSPALWVGAVVCGLGVFEFTAREHFSGYRSHTWLLAAFPAVIVVVAIAVIFGVPKLRLLLYVPALPVFALSFWLLQRAFRGARHARVVRSPAP